MIDYVVTMALIASGVVATVVMSVLYFDRRVQDKDWENKKQAVILFDCLTGIIAICYYSVLEWVLTKFGVNVHHSYDEEEDWI